MNDLRLSRQEHVPQGTSICLTWTWTRQVIPLCMRRWKAVPPSGRSSEVLHCERALLHVTHTHLRSTPVPPTPSLTHSLTHEGARMSLTYPHVHFSYTFTCSAVQPSAFCCVQRSSTVLSPGPPQSRAEQSRPDPDPNAPATESLTQSPCPVLHRHLTHPAMTPLVHG